jgi:hypothetical protein
MGTPVQAGVLRDLAEHISGDRIPAASLNSTQQPAWFRQALVTDPEPEPPGSLGPPGPPVAA